MAVTSHSHCLAALQGAYRATAQKNAGGLVESAARGRAVALTILEGGLRAVLQPLTLLLPAATALFVLREVTIAVRLLCRYHPGTSMLWVLQFRTALNPKCLRKHSFRGVLHPELSCSLTCRIQSRSDPFMAGSQIGAEGSKIRVLLSRQQLFLCFNLTWHGYTK